MSPEFIGILTLGLATIGLLVAFWRDTRADTQNLRAEVRADIQSLRADNQSLRKDMQALTERMSRVEGVIEGLFGGRGARDRHDDAA